MSVDLTKPRRIWTRYDRDIVEFIEAAPVYALIRDVLDKYPAGRETDAVAALIALLPEEST